MAILTKHVVMGKHIAASGSLAGEMKVAAISGSTGLTLNQMLIKLDDNATTQSTAYIAADAVIVGDAAGSYDTLGKLENFIIALQADVDQNESDSDSAESTLTTNLGALSGAFDARFDIINGSGNGSITKAIADLVDSAPGALNTLNELAAALADDAGFSTTITNLVAGVSGSVDKVEAALGAMIDTDGNYVAHSGKYYINANSNVTTDLIDLDAAIKVQELAIAADAVHLANVVTLSGVAEDAVHLGTFSGATITNDQTVKAAIQLLETKAEAVQTDVDANEAAEKLRLDHANGFHVEKDGFVWKMGWGVNSPRLSFEINADASVTMSVDKETA